VIRKTGSLIAVLALAWALAPLPARAATTWNTNVNPSSTSCPAGTCTTQHEGLVNTDPNMIPYGNQFTFKSTVGNIPLNAEAYYVSTNATSSKLNAANIEEYVGNGIGVTSQSTAAVKYTGDQNLVGSPSFVEDVGNSPGHTIDNQGVYDMVVFQLPSSNFDVTQIALETFSSSQYSSGAADFTVFAGGNSAADALSLAGFAGVTLAQLTSTYGFTEISYPSSGNGTYNINPNNLTGRYLIVAASLANTKRNDDFKIASIAGTTLLTKVPEPSSITLLLVAALSMFYLWRRRAPVRC
jgi:PEP-CTERM motif